MAAQPISSAPTVWASATTTIDALHQQLGSATGDRRAIEDRLTVAEDELLDLHAPDIAGVIRKLEVLWDGQLHAQDRISGHKLTLLEDLQRLAAA
ncbi:hypothetical protein [Novosphingobium sp. HII-3]|uniref:hypothetical protein n=1 Tax=Novosphingobium sp. HII-3 TaxID=2075565 RepID=UPI000CDB6B1F|nr:hypothetical protein [Novosphingobium sp. HII-3]